MSIQEWNKEEYGKDGRGRKKDKGMGGRGDFPHL